MVEMVDKANRVRKIFAFLAISTNSFYGCNAKGFIVYFNLSAVTYVHVSFHMATAHRRICQAFGDDKREFHSNDWG
jgi:hypothetical protein